MGLRLYIYKGNLLHNCSDLSESFPEDMDLYHNYYKQSKDVFYCNNCNIQFPAFLALGWKSGVHHPGSRQGRPGARSKEVFIGEQGIFISNLDLKFTQILIL